MSNWGKLRGVIRCWTSRTSLLHTSRPSTESKKPDLKKLLADFSEKFYQKSEFALERTYEKTRGVFGAVDELLGITEVREAQSKVRAAEEECMATRKHVQVVHSELSVVQERLNEVRRRLDRTPRDDEGYLALATEEHTILLEEKKLKNDFECLEARERDQFSLLSALVRESHEKERSRTDRTKHWSVIGSLGGAALGILGSSLMNYVRLKEIKNSVKASGQELMGRTTELQDAVREQSSQLEAQKTELNDNLSGAAQRLEQRVAELSGVLELFTLNQTGDSLFKGVFLGSDNLQSGTSTRGAQHLGIDPEGDSQAQIVESLKELNSRVESVLWLVKEECGGIRKEVAVVGDGIDRLESRQVLRKGKSENRTQNVPRPLASMATPHSEGTRAEWWSKLNAATSILCVAISAAALAHELFK